MMSTFFLMMLLGIPGLFLALLGFGFLIRFLPELFLGLIAVGLIRRLRWRRRVRYYRRYYW